jgi:hypothetical protein
LHLVVHVDVLGLDGVVALLALGMLALGMQHSLGIAERLGRRSVYFLLDHGADYLLLHVVVVNHLELHRGQRCHLGFDLLPGYDISVP